MEETSCHIIIKTSITGYRYVSDIARHYDRFSPPTILLLALISVDYLS